MDLLAIGDCSIDLYMKINIDSAAPEKGDDPKHPVVCFYHGSKIPVEDFETSIGGNALNVAVGAQKLGLKTALYTETGDDNNSERIVEELNKVGVDTSFMSKNSDIDTDLHAILVCGGERTIFSYHGKKTYKIQDWPKPKFVYYSSMGPNFGEFQKDLLDYLKENQDIGLAFNPGSVHMKLGLESFSEVLKITDVLFVNKQEAEILVGDKGDLEMLHKKLGELGPKLNVITDGKKGASAFDDERVVTQDIYSDQRPMLDKTGAGDSFASGFISAIIHGKNLEEALKWGVVNSGSVIKEIGAIGGLLDRDSLDKIVSEVL